MILMSKLQTLSLLSLNSVRISIHEIISIRNLSVVEELYDKMYYEICFVDHRTLHLKRSVITDFECDFNDLTCFVKYTLLVGNS